MAPPNPPQDLGVGRPGGPHTSTRLCVTFLQTWEQKWPLCLPLEMLRRCSGGFGLGGPSALQTVANNPPSAVGPAGSVFT